MATTAIQIGDIKMKFMTLPAHLTNEEGVKQFLDITLYQCDEDFIPTGQSSHSMHEDDEETYHRTLRLQATEKGHYVPEESTDPQWNPNYIEPEEDGNEDTLPSDMLGQQE